MSQPEPKVDPFERKITLFGVLFNILGFVAIITWLNGVIYSGFDGTANINTEKLNNIKVADQLIFV